MKIAWMSMLLSFVLVLIFFLISKKEKPEKMKSSTFECGFTSYFYSRFSFSIHYYLLGLIFLFLDLELCVMLPMLTEMESSIKMKKTLSMFIMTLLGGLMLEWKEGKLEWKF